VATVRLLAELAEDPEIRDAELAGRLRVWESAITAELALRSKNKMGGGKADDRSQAPEGA
jgi:hypothetical protein